MPINAFDYIKAAEIIGYYEEAQKYEPINYVGEALFPNVKQDTLTAAYLTGKSSYPRLLTPSAYDADPTLRPREMPEVKEEEILFFRESMLLTEKDRRGLLQVEATGNAALIESYAAKIVEDKSKLITGARARNELMRMEILSTGKIEINDNGVILSLDYGIGDSQKSNATVSWSDPATSTPITDLLMASRSGKKRKTRALMTTKTFNDLMASNQVKGYLVPQGMDPNLAIFPDSQVEDLVERVAGVRIALVDEYYELKDKTERQMFPDDVVTLFPAVSRLGDTRFAPSPEEYDFKIKKELPVSGMEFALYNNVISVISEYLSLVPVKLRTSVAMNALPTLDVANDIHILSTIASV